MERYKNGNISYGGKKFEIFWVTEYAEHIVKREKDSSHLITLKEVEKLAKTAFFFDYKNMVYGIEKFKGKWYMMPCYIVSAPKRCVIKSCHVVNNSDLLYICRNLKR